MLLRDTGLSTGIGTKAQRAGVGVPDQPRGRRSGLNLTEADYVYVLDPWWNRAAEAQAVDRAHRIGQAKAVMVYRLVAADTIEQKVVALQARKRDLFARVLDDEAGALSGQLTADDIRGLFA
jgi:SNF2 family DNA or RNA helicase